MNRRNLYIIILILFFLRISISAGKKTHVIDSDGAAKYIDLNGSKKTDHMHGKTPYGKKIKEYRRIVNSDNIFIEIIYSKKYSDDNMNGNVRSFYRIFFQQIRDWAYINTKQKLRMKIIVSNCRFSKTGFCRKMSEKIISIISYRNNKMDKVFIFYHRDIVKLSGQVRVAKNAVNAILK